MAKCAKGIQNAHFSKGQKLTHSPAHVGLRLWNQDYLHVLYSSQVAL